MGDVTVDLVRIDDWEVLYIDGEKVDSGHRLDAMMVLEAMWRKGLLDGIAVSSIPLDGTEVEEKAIWEGDLPDLRELPKELVEERRTRIC